MSMRSSLTPPPTAQEVTDHVLRVVDRQVSLHHPFADTAGLVLCGCDPLDPAAWSPKHVTDEIRKALT